MEELKQQLTQVINSCELPAECVYYIVKDIYRDIDFEYQRLLKAKREEAARQAALSEAEENKQEEE